MPSRRAVSMKGLKLIRKEMRHLCIVAVASQKGFTRTLPSEMPSQKD
jgi:hypothetical protein